MGDGEGAEGDDRCELTSVQLAATNCYADKTVIAPAGLNGCLQLMRAIRYSTVDTRVADTDYVLNLRKAARFER